MRKYRDMQDRLLSNSIVDENGCWYWLGRKNKRGYGRLNVRENGKHVTKYAHRVAYEIFVKSIQKSMQIDHVCFNQSCINPDHLRVVSIQENLSTRRKYAKIRGN